MTAPFQKKATYADLLALPDNVVGEIIHGELHVSPRPSPRHALATSALGGELSGPFQRGRGGPGGWWILFEPELHLGGLRDEAQVPDLAGWKRERMPSMPLTAFFPLAPDWVCEVLSKSTTKVDLKEKLPYYAQHGVGHAWIVNPVFRTLEVLRNEKGNWLVVSIHTGDERVRASPFEAFELELSALWDTASEPEESP